MHNRRAMSAFRGLNHALRQLRLERGMTQADLAEAADFGRASVQAWESGRSHPRLKTLERLLEAMDAGLPDLLRHLKEAAACGGGRKRRTRRSRPSLYREARQTDSPLFGFHGFLASLADLMQEQGEPK